MTAYADRIKPSLKKWRAGNRNQSNSRFPGRMKASKGFRRGTRRRLKGRTRDKFRVGDFLKDFRPDDRVAVKINPTSHKGMPHPRFEGKTGRIKEKRGDSYVIEIPVGRARKTVTARPEHLKHVR